MRVGIGFDAHAFDPSRPLVVGGVTIPGAPGLAGHSDADVLSHAVADALLGAAALGDLGDYFPADDRWKDASSLDVLAETGRLLERAGWSIVNIDATVVAESPQLGPHRNDMSGALARVLQLEPHCVSVKATTTDRLGFAGRGEGMAAFAVALVTRSSD